MKNPIPRWHQRLDHYLKALRQLTLAVELHRARPLSQIEMQGFVKAFEFSYELAWSLMKDYFAFQGNNNLTGSRDAFREAFQKGLVTDGEKWMEMIELRNLTSHSYDEAVAKELVAKIELHYFQLFNAFALHMTGLRDG